MTGHDQTYYNNMNALECRTLELTVSCMQDSCACIAWLTVYACSISKILNYIPCTWICMFMVQFKSSESVHDPGVGEGTWLCHYTNWKLLWLPKLNYPLESHCLFTLSLHWQLTSKAQNSNQSCTEVRAICKHRLATAAHYYMYYWNMTTIPIMSCVPRTRCIPDELKLFLIAIREPDARWVPSTKIL